MDNLRQHALMERRSRIRQNAKRMTAVTFLVKDKKITVALEADPNLNDFAGQLSNWCQLLYTSEQLTIVGKTYQQISDELYEMVATKWSIVDTEITIETINQEKYIIKYSTHQPLQLLSI